MFDVIAIEAALCGSSKATLYVDNLNDPQVLLLWNGFDGFYLSADMQFDCSLIKDTISRIMVDDTNENSEYVLYIDPKHDSIVGYIIPTDGCNYEKLDVLGYFIEPKTIEPTTLEGFKVVDIDKDFFKFSYTNAEEILTTISQTWHSTDAFYTSGFGIAVISSGTVAAFCITEHVTDSGAEFSIETMPEFQKKGLGTLAGQSMISACKNRRKDAYWYCTPDNKASIRLAEKLGLTHKYSFHVWLF